VLVGRLLRTLINITLLFARFVGKALPLLNGRIRR